MVDKNMIPETEDLIRRTSEESAIRAKTISSLSNQMNLSKEKVDNKIKNLSEEVSSLSKIEKSNKKIIETLEEESIKPEVKSVLNQLNNSLHSFANGMLRITSETASASRDVVSQYGRAISQDVSLNKENIVAMSLARSSPIFGYFASKFVGTEVYKSLVDKFKNQLGTAISSLAGAAKGVGESIFAKTKSLFSKERTEVPKTTEPLGEISSRLGDIQAIVTDKTPELQEGGFIKEEGIVKVHAAEVVSPIDKILEVIDESGPRGEITKKLTNSISIMSESMARMEGYVAYQQKERKGIIEDFITAFREAKNIKEMTWQDRMLRAILELKLSLVGTTSRLRIAWQRTLVEHPMFRNILLLSDAMKSAFISPLRFLFGVRGGYASDIRNATNTNNVFLKISNVLNIFYSNLMPKIDNLVKYTKEILEFQTGKEAIEVKEKTWTMFDKIKDIMEGKTENKPFGESLFNNLINSLNLSRESLERAGITKISDLSKPKEIAEKAGITRESLASKAKEKIVSPISEWFKGGIESIKEKIPKFQRGGIVEETGPALVHKNEIIIPSVFSKVLEKMSALPRKIDLLRKESKKHFDKISSVEEIKISIFTKIRKSSEAAKDKIGGLSTRIKKMGSGIWKYMLIGLTFVKNLFSPLIGSITKWIPIMAAGILAFGKGIVGSAMASVAGGLGAVKGGLGSIAGKAATLAGGAAGLGGIAWGGMHAYEAVKKAKDWKTSKTSAGIGGFLGGTEENMSVSGAAKGAAKGGMIGAGIGSIVPGIGTAIGGAVGAIAGGIMGFIGGKNIAKGLDYLGTGIKKVVKSVVEFITWPFRLLAKAISRAKEWAYSKLESIPLIGRIVKWLKSKGELDKEEKFTGTSTAAPIDLGKAVDKTAIARSEIARSIAEGKITANELSKENKKLSESMTKNAANTSAAIINSTNIISSAANNYMNSQTSGGGGRSSNQSFSSGDRFAQQVLQCDIG